MTVKSFHGRHLSKVPVPALVTYSTDCANTSHSAWFPSVGAAARWIIFQLAKYPKLLYYVEPTTPLVSNTSNVIPL